MNILVLCTGNSARSIILESILNSMAKGRWRAFSAGSQPTGAVHPGALKVLKKNNIQSFEARSKSWDEFAGPDAPEMDLVITVCGNAANETCPVWPGTPMRSHWGVEDPAAATDDTANQAFDLAYEILNLRAGMFSALQSENRNLAEQQGELDAIGIAGPPSA